MNEFGLKQDLLDFILQSAQANEVNSLILFGSRATGKFHSRSDIDLAVSGGNIHAFIADMQEKSPTLLKFDIIDLDSNPSSDLISRISQEGVMLYG